MGIIKRQAFQSSVLIYSGVLIGFLTTGLLVPNLLEESEIGTLKLLHSYAAMFMSLGLLGFGTVTLRFLPHFFNKTDKKYNGFLGISLIVGTIGSLLATVFILAIKPSMVESNIEKSPQFAHYFFLIIPLTIFQIYYNLFDSYKNALGRSSYGVFLRDFVQRILVFIGIILVFTQIFSFNEYIYYYISAICFPTILIFINLLWNKALDIKINFRFLNRSIFTSMASVGAFGLLNSFGGIAVLQIDTIMLNMFLDADAVGVYAITFYFGTLVIIPAKALNRIAPTLIAKAYKEQDFETIKDIYYKSTANLFLIGALLLIGLLVNLENIFSIIPKSYEVGKNVIILIGFANLAKMAAGSNDSIITFSKYYKMTTVFLIFLVIFLIVLNFIFIPSFGITGAALASLTAILIHNLIKFIFIKMKFGFSPYNFQYVLVLLACALIYFVVSLLPEFENFIIEIAIDSICAAILFYFSIKYLPMAEEANEYGEHIIDKALKIIRSKFK